MLERIEIPVNKDTLQLMSVATTVEPASCIGMDHNSLIKSIIQLHKETNHTSASQYDANSIILKNGYVDVESMHHLALDDARILQRQLPSREVAMSIAEHPATLATIAAHALLPEKVFKSVVSSQRDLVGYRVQGLQGGNPDDFTRCFILDDQQESIIVNPGFITSNPFHTRSPYSESGCPFAKPSEGHRRSPLFDKFVVWAGQVAVHRYYAQLTQDEITKI